MDGMKGYAAEIDGRNEAARKMAEFLTWQHRVQLLDDVRLTSILKAWGFQVGRA